MYPWIRVADYHFCLTLEGMLSAKKLDKNSQITIVPHANLTHIYDNHIKFKVSLHFWWIWPTVTVTHAAVMCTEK